MTTTNRSEENSTTNQLSEGKLEPFTLQFDRLHKFEVTDNGAVTRTISVIEYLQKQNAANTQRCAEGCLDFDMASLKMNTESIRGM